MFGTLISAVTSISPLKRWLAIGAILLAAAGAGFAAWWVTHKIDLGTINGLKAQYATAEASAVKQALALKTKEDDIALAASVADAASQQRIVVHTITLTKEVVRHVSDHSPCITFGFIRVLDAAVLGVSADALNLPAGQSDSTCAPADAAAVARSIAANYGTARQNAQQLDDLADYVLDLIAEQNKFAPSQHH